MSNAFSLEPRSYSAPSTPVSGPRSVTIMPLKFNAATLIAQVADGWLEYSRLADLAPTTVINRTSAIRSLGYFLTQDDDRTLALHKPGNHLTERLYAWEQHQIETRSKTSQRSQSLAQNLKRFTKAYLVKHEIDGPDLHRWADSKPLLYQPSHDGHNPLDEFSNAERLLLEQAFKNVIRAGEALLEAGERLLDQGLNPQEHGWESLSNLVWGLKHLSPEVLPKEMWSPKGRSQLWHKVLDAAPEMRRHQKHYFGNPAIGLLYPHMFHLQALQCLLILKTGWSPEEVSGLVPSDVLVGDNNVRIKATKNRAHKIRYRDLPRSSSGLPGWKSGDLIIRVLTAMRHIPRDSQTPPVLWIGALTGRQKGRKEFLQTLTGSTQFSFGKLVNACDIDIGLPHDRRRLRKTTKSAKAVLLGTLAGSAGDDHSIEVFRHHYAQTTTIHTIAARTVMSAQNLVMEKIGPTVIPTHAANLEADQLDANIASALEETKTETATDKQLSIAACSDPNNPPGSPGSLCLDAPRKCLECSNAVIFAEHLPRLKTYREILKNIEKTMPPRQFETLYGQQLVNIEAAIAKFPDSPPTQHTTPVRLPLTMRTTS